MDTKTEVMTKSGWVWLDGDRNGVAECYYFDDAGWALMDTTYSRRLHGNADGAWYVGDPDNGVKEMEVEVKREKAEQEAIDKKKPRLSFPRRRMA